MRDPITLEPNFPSNMDDLLQVKKKIRGQSNNFWCSIIRSKLITSIRIGTHNSQIVKFTANFGSKSSYRCFIVQGMLWNKRNEHYFRCTPSNVHTRGEMWILWIISQILPIESIPSRPLENYTGLEVLSTKNWQQRRASTMCNNFVGFVDV